MQLRASHWLLAALLPILWLWWRLLKHLHIAWEVNPEYSYGWLVPMLCLCLAWRRASEGRAGLEKSSGTANSPFSFSMAEQWSLVLLCGLWLPTRLIEESNPEWRLVSWALALETIGITLILLRYVLHLAWRWQSDRRGKAGDSAVGVPGYQFAFAICFFLVAVPWPTFVEKSLIQALTRGNSACAVEILNVCGVPAILQGNLLEVSTGVVGIEEACSGIRSFQSSLMLALFFGEFFAFSLFRRLFLCGLGFVLAFGFNIVRTTLLAGVAAHKGIPAIATWHDPTGASILAACFTSLGAVAWLWARAEEKAQPSRKRMPEQVQEANGPEEAGQECREGATRAALPRETGYWPRPEAIVAGIVAWLLLAEVGTELWYRSRERNLPAAVTWTIDMPRKAAGFKEQPLPEKARQLLRYDQSLSASWSDAEGCRWQAVFLRWNPGKIAVHLAKNHTPEICLAGAGKQLRSQSDLRYVTAHGLHLPFRIYSLQDRERSLHVFFCLWEDRAENRAFDTTSVGYANRLQPVLEGRRNCGQRSLEIAVWGIDDSARAEAALLAEVKNLVR